MDDFVPDADSLLTDFACQQGWSVYTQLNVLLDFINASGGKAALREYLKVRAVEESGELTNYLCEVYGEVSKC